MFDLSASLSASVSASFDFDASAQLEVGSSAEPAIPAKTTDPHTSCRFYVAVDGVPQAVFTEVSGLGLEMAVEEFEEGGNNDYVHRFPGRCKLGTLSLKRGVTASLDFFNWTLQIAQGKITKKHLSLIIYQTNGEQITRWDFLNAFPIKWSGPQLSSTSDSISIESIDFAHEGVQVN